MSRQSGLTERDLASLTDYERSELFSESETLALTYTTHLTQTPASVSDSLFESLKMHFDVKQLVEMTALAAWENYRSRFNRGFDVQSQGFSEETVCQLPPSEHEG